MLDWRHKCTIFKDKHNLITELNRPGLMEDKLTRASSDCGRIFTIALCGVWKETLRASFYFYLRNGEISKTARISLQTAIFVVRTNPD